MSDDKKTVMETVLLLLEIRVFLPPHQRDEVERLALSMASRLPEADRPRLLEMGRERQQAREDAQERRDNAMVWVRAKPIEDPQLAWQMGLLRGKKIAVEAWLDGEQFPEEMLIEIEAEIEDLRSKG